MASRRYSSCHCATGQAGVIRPLHVSPLRSCASTTVSCDRRCALPILIGLGARWSAKADARRASPSTNAQLSVENDNYREATGQLSSQIVGACRRRSMKSASSRGCRSRGEPRHGAPAGDREVARDGRRHGAGRASSAARPSAPADTAFGVLRDLLGAIEDRLDAVRDRRREAPRCSPGATPSIWPVAGWLSSPTATAAIRSRAAATSIPASTSPPTAASPCSRPPTASSRASSDERQLRQPGRPRSRLRYRHEVRPPVTLSPSCTGSRFSRGDVIGYVGSTGRSTSPHLHYEIWVNGQLTNPMRLLAHGKLATAAQAGARPAA